MNLNKNKLLVFMSYRNVYNEDNIIVLLEYKINLVLSQILIILQQFL